jgi:pimeloyl-ACP methyl ester carboxylesterase
MPQTKEAVFYQLYFQTPGVAEAELERDVHHTIRSLLYSISGDAPPVGSGATATTAVGMVDRERGLLAGVANPASLPSWMTENDVDFYAAEFARTGFRGGLNWYRNIDRNWELLAPFAGARVTVPALYVAGDRDIVLAFPGVSEAVKNLAAAVPQLRGTVILPGCGHWTQQERAAEVNAAMIDFLRRL